MNDANKSYGKEGLIAESWGVVIAVEIVRVFLIIFTRRTLSEF